MPCQILFLRGACIVEGGMSDKKPLAIDPFGNEIFMADTMEIERRNANVNRLLWLVAPYMGWEDLSHVFVSDRSSLGDFCLEESALAEISKKLGFDVRGDDLIWELAMRMERPA